MVALQDLHPDSRVWIFQAEHELTSEQQTAIQEHLTQFINNWASHGTPLNAGFEIREGRFVVIAQDVTLGGSASGCSIDSMTQQIQLLETHLGVGLMDRTTVYYQSDDGVQATMLHGLSDVLTSSTKVYDPLVKTLRDYLSKFVVPAGESWHKRFL